MSILGGDIARWFMLKWILISLASIGLLISLYFTLVYYNLLARDAKFVPRVCQLSEQTCQRILTTRDARVLGIPNFLLGLLYYLGLILLGSFDVIRASMPAGEAVMIASLFTVLLGAYLTYSLVWKLRVVCVLCITSHAVNVLIAVILYLLFYC